MDKLYINDNATIIEAFKKMDEVGFKLLICVENGQYKNLLSIGDLQRALINGGQIETRISEIEIGPKEIGRPNEDSTLIYDKMEELKSPFMPIINENNEVVKIIYANEISQKSNKGLENIQVVIMAGGKGTRLQPITNIIPKPLVPIGEKPIVQCIMDKFHNCGATDFHFSVNYKWEVIRDYFKSFEHPFNIEYFVETQPLGTAGSLSLMRDELTSTFFISNCDIIIEDDYENILEYHKANRNLITIVACLKNYSIPYGTMTRTEDGLLDKMQEKPDNTYLINTGMYILEPECLDYVPDNAFFHITELIAMAKKDKKRVGIFPISEGSWKDIGEWPEYLKNYVNIN